MSFWYTCRMPAADKADQEKGLRHQLGAGQMAMIAVGGSIGTGLLLGSAAALEIAGPGVILSFALAALITLTVTMALGELSSVHPGAGSFGLYGDLYLNQWAGFIARAGYWAALSISIGAELVASATYLAFWFPSVPALFWVVIFSAMLLLINLRSVGNYARFEYWFAMIKVAAIVAFIVLGVGLLLSGRVAPQYTTQGGFLPHGSKAPWLAMGFAIYTFAGVEFVAITTGESRSATEIPRAIKLTFAILTSIYLGAIIILVGVMPWNRGGASAGKMGAEECVRLHPGRRAGGNAAVLAGLSGGSRQIPPETFIQSGRRPADAFAIRGLGFHARVLADHRGSARNRLALSPDADQRRGVRGSADGGLFPAKEKIALRRPHVGRSMQPGRAVQ